MTKKLLAEVLGTFVLVFCGCGAATSLPCSLDVPGSVVGTSLAFGLSVVAMAYAVGAISGGHFNPAITLGCMLTKRISNDEGVKYMGAQIVGALIGAALLAFLTADAGRGVGANDLQGSTSTVVGLVAEIIGTFIFVLVVLGTTDKKTGAGNFAGLAIGLSLVLVHLVLINYTGTSVNPARSIAPALFTGGTALSNLWIFIVGPFVGAALSAVVWNFMSSDKD